MKLKYKKNEKGVCFFLKVKIVINNNLYTTDIKTLPLIKSLAITIDFFFIS